MRLDNPLFSLAASGKLGKFVYSNRKGVRQARYLTKQKHVRTDEQSFVRNAVGEAVEEWRLAEESLRNDYVIIGARKGYSGYHFWVSVFVSDDGFDTQRFGESFFGR